MERIRVGVLGLGMMGPTHLDVYAQRRDVEVVAVADRNADKLAGLRTTQGNIEGQTRGRFDLSQVRTYASPEALIDEAELDLIDICLPTPLHVELALRALAAGHHVLVEKPVALTLADTRRLAHAAANSDRIVMPAMCMRYWPGWDWLKQAVMQGRYGPVRGASFRRLATHPGGKLYLDAHASGAAILDLHLHDSDFILHCFGRPTAVASRGYASVTAGIDHVHTLYRYDAPASAASSAAPPLVTAEGGWAMAPGFPFTMQYTVNFEQATAVFDLHAKDHLLLYRAGQAESIPLDPEMGYAHEIADLLRCIHEGVKPTRVTMADAVEAMTLIEAERTSVQRDGNWVDIPWATP